jgi:hypothetical protein
MAHLHASKKYHFEEFTRWETTYRESFLDPKVMKPSPTVMLPPIKKKVSKLGGVGIFETETHFSLELPQKLIREQLKLKRKRHMGSKGNVHGIKLKSLAIRTEGESQQL